VTEIRLITDWAQLVPASEILSFGLGDLRIEDWLYNYQDNSIIFKYEEDAIAFKLRLGKIINSVDKLV
jgi:hypothetical protein